MRILVLSRNASLYSTSRIVLAARARGHTVTVTDPLEFQIVVSRGRPSLMHGGAELPRYDVIIPRIGASITNYGLAVVRQFDMMGVPVLNSAVSIARSRDKLRALQLLTRKRIDVPITVCARSPASIDAALEMVGGCPAIVKIQQGTQGIGTMIAETPQAVSSLLETLWAMGQDIVLQEYIDESRGRDIRTIVVGGRVIASMRRTAKAGEFRSNLHRGGLAVKVALPPAYGPRGRGRRHPRRQGRAEDPRDQQLARSRRDRARDVDGCGERDRRARGALLAEDVESPLEQARDGAGRENDRR
jgi:ribosomal protein S6--L-glutamate ligase